MGQRRLQDALRDLDQIHPDDRDAWHATIDQAADFAAMLAVQVDPIHTHGLHEPLRATAADLAAAARLSRPDPTAASRPHRPIVLPTLLSCAQLLARTKTPELAIALLVIAAFAALILALADRQRHDRKPGQSGAHLRAAATHLAPYQIPTKPGSSPPDAPRRSETPKSTPSIGQRPSTYRPSTQVRRGRTR
jgi:hypothetical protein